jgi:Mg2+ and Co2+ transporter CorA
MPSGRCLNTKRLKQHRRLVTTLARLLAQKQRLIDRLQGNPGPEEREEIERLLEQINTALDFLDEAGPGISEKDES